jgi:aromatic ring-opening dioxygenase LigB subunit
MPKLARLIVVLASLAAAGARGELVASAVLPHGDEGWLPELAAGGGAVAVAAAARVRAAAEAAAAAVLATRPETVVLVSPHAQATRDAWLVYANSAASGAAELGQGQQRRNASAPRETVRAERQGDAALAAAIVRSAACTADEAVRCVALESWADSEPQPLRWGEVLPSAWLLRADPNATFRLVVLSVPTRRHNSTAHMVPELLRFGRQLARTLAELPQRVALVASVDLAHTHSPDGPYNFSDAAQPFDQAVERWARAATDQARRAALLTDAARLVDRALSCGYPGMVLMQGAFDAERMRGTAATRRCWANVTEPVVEAPTYYGMLAAAFAPHLCLSRGALGPDLDQLAPSRLR